MASGPLAQAPAVHQEAIFSSVLVGVASTSMSTWLLVGLNYAPDISINFPTMKNILILP